MFKPNYNLTEPQKLFSFFKGKYGKNRLSGYSGIIRLVVLITTCISFTATVHAQYPPRVEEPRKKALEIYSKAESPEISFERFFEINKEYFYNRVRYGVPSNNDSTDACSKLTKFCSNGQLEGLDDNKWWRAYGVWTGGLKIAKDNPDFERRNIHSFADSSTRRYKFYLKYDGLDYFGRFPFVMEIGNSRSLRLGNQATGFGAEMIAKTFVVKASQAILHFWYAVVFQDVRHSREYQPAFSVNVYDCETNNEISNVCDLGNGTNTVVAETNNPFFKFKWMYYPQQITYREWTKATIDLSAYVGKKVTVVLTNKDCGHGGHFGYTYLDNFYTSACLLPDIFPDPGTEISQPKIRFDEKMGISCGRSVINIKTRLPSYISNGIKVFGKGVVTLNILVDGKIVETFSSYQINPPIPLYDSFAYELFDIGYDVIQKVLAANSGAVGFDYTVHASFNILGHYLPFLFIGTFPSGQRPGLNNDYLLKCPAFYSKPTGDLHDVQTWGKNPDGSGDSPPHFGNDSTIPRLETTYYLANRSDNYVMTGDWRIPGTLYIPEGSQLKINGYTLSVGTLNGSGPLAGSRTSNLIMVGRLSHYYRQYTFAKGSDTLKSLTVNLFNPDSYDIINSPLTIYDQLTVSKGWLIINDTFTLKSTAAGTARVAPVTGRISGEVTVERYIPARRAWRLMNAPVSGIQTVNQAWQEGATTASAVPNPNPGYGTHITGGSLVNGFDQSLQASASLKSFTASGALQNVSGTNSTLVGNTPYMLFVRGDRSVSLAGTKVPANNTTLRATGTLLTGDQTIPVAATGYTAVANPFASPINFATITRNNVKNSFYLWDPKMGGTYGVGAYVNVSFNGTGYDVTPASTSPESQYIQSGQSFIVQSTGTAGSLVIKESDKSATPAQNVFRQANPGDQQSAEGGLVFAPAKHATGLRVNLQPSDGSQQGVLDEVFASYSSNFSDEIDDMDALKVENVMENLSIIRKGQELMVDRRNVIQTADTLRLNMTNLTATGYMFEFSPIDLSEAESVTLIDNYLKTTTDISLTATSQVYFLTGSDSRASAPDRFSVIISYTKNRLQSLAGKSNIRAYPNPVTANGNINLQFSNIKSGMYRIDIVNSLGQTVYSRMMQINEGAFNQQVNISRNLPAGVYQMKCAGNDFSTVLKIIVAK